MAKNKPQFPAIEILGFADEQAFSPYEVSPDDSPGVMRGIGDSALALGRGVVTGGKMLSDVFGAGNPVSGVLGAGDEVLGTLESPQRQAERQRRAQIIAEAEKSGSTAAEIAAYLGAFGEAPLDTTLNAAGTAVPTIGAAMLAGGAGPIAAGGAALGMGAVQGAGVVKGAIYDQVKAELVAQGVPDAEAERRAIRAQEYGGENRGLIAAGAGAGAVAGRFGAEGTMIGRMAGTSSPNAVRRTLGAGAAEMIPEGAQGAQEQYAANVATQRQGIDVPTFRGVAGSGVLEGVAGFGVGAGLGAVTPPAGPLTRAADIAAGVQAGQEEAARQVLALPAPPAQAAEWEVVDDRPQLPGSPARLALGFDPGEADSTIMVDSRGNAARAPDAWVAQADARRQDDVDLGLTPDVRAAQARRTGGTSEQADTAVPAESPRATGVDATGDAGPARLPALGRPDGEGADVSAGRAATGTDAVVPVAQPEPVSALSVTFGGRTFPVDSPEDAAAKWNRFRDESGAGASEIGNGVEVKNAQGEVVARISYNGRIFDADGSERTPARAPRDMDADWWQGMTPLARKDAAIKAKIGSRVKQDSAWDSIGAKDRARLEAVRQQDEQEARRMFDEGGTAIAVKPQSKPRTREEVSKERKRVYRETHPFRSFLAERGVSVDDRSDVGGERTRPVMVPYHGPLFRKAGLHLDELARRAVEAGFLTQADIDSDLDNGGVNKLSDMIRRSLAGERILAVSQAESEQEAGWRAQMDARYEAMAEAEAAAREATDDEINALLQLASDEDAELRNEEIDVALEPGEAQEAGGRPQETATGTAPGGDSRGSAETRDESPGAVDDDLSDVPFALNQQTADDVRRQEAQRRKDEAKAEREAAEQARRDAAPPPGDFTLTGSDRPADEAAARGQMELGATPQNAEKAAPLYASRPVTNAADIIAWAKTQGFKTTLPADDMHVTVAYSREPMDGTKPGAATPSVSVAGGARSVEPLGDGGAVVLKFESEPMQSRWQQYRDAGASWDYEGYQPHITLTYDAAGLDLSKVEPYSGPIVLGAEKQEALDVDKAEDYKGKEEATGARDGQAVGRDGLTDTERASNRLDGIADELARQVQQESSERDFAPSDVPTVIEQWAKDNEVDAGELRARVLDRLRKRLSEGRMRQVERSLSGAGRPAPPAIGEIDRTLATRAFEGTSHTPDRRGENARSEYVSVLRAAWDEAVAIAGDDPAALDRIRDEFEKLRDGYRRRYEAYLGAHSRVMSSMIVGPARFPTERNRRRGDAADKRANEANDFLRKGIARLKKAARAPIDNTPTGEVERIRKNLAERERAQEQMKAANAALRKGDDAALREMGFSDAQIAELKKPDFAGRTGFPSYRLTNNQSEIRRLRERLAQAEGRVEAAAAGPVSQQTEGVRIEEDAEANRIRLIFDGKPDEATRNALKSAGFRWAPSVGAWQRQLTDNARREARRIAGLDIAEPTAQYRVDEPQAYQADLFGDPLPAPEGRSRGAGSDRARVRGNVQPAAALSDTEAPAGEYLLRTVLGTETSRQLGASVIQTHADAARATKYLYRNAVERFDGIVTDKNGKPLAVVGGFKGALSQASVYPATLIGEAVRIPGAARIWFSHNHPSGTAELSNADLMLHRALNHAFRGSGIEPMGLLAVAGDSYAFDGVTKSGLPGDTQSNLPITGKDERVEVPVIERMIAPDGVAGRQVLSPTDAKVVASTFYGRTKEPGLVLLSAQNHVVAWVPLSPNMLGNLRDTGGLKSLYRAVSESTVGAAIIVHGGELSALPRFPGDVSVIQNIGAALKQVEVTPLDAIDVVKGHSHAEHHASLAEGPVFSRGGAATGIPEAEVQRAADAMRAGWENAPEVVVVADMSDTRIPEDVRSEDAQQRSEGAAGAPEGFFADGKVYLVASELGSAADVVRVLAHEALGHAGLRGLFGKRLAGILDQIVRARPADIRAKLREYGLKDTPENRRVAAEEVLATMAQDQPSLGFVRRAIAAIRAWLRDLGLNLRLSNDDIVANFILPSRQFVMGRGRGGAASGGVAFSRDDDIFVSEVLAELAQYDEAFRYAVSKNASFAGIFNDVFPEAEYLGEDTRIEEKEESGADVRHVVRGANGKMAYIFERGREVWLDISRFKEGDRGDGVYAAVMNYAHNNGKKFIGDPAGLSEAAVVRRTSAMLSAALRYGTTRHMDAAPEQLAGIPDKGIAPLKWQGDDFEKTTALIDSFLSTLYTRFPTLKGYRYDFRTNQFLDRSGRPVGSDRFSLAGEGPVARRAFAGSATARRGIFIQSLVSSEGGKRPELLEHVLRRGRALVADGGPARAMFSRRTQISENIADLFQSHKGFNWWHKTIGTQYEKAQRNAHFGRVFERAQQYLHDISDLANRAADHAPSILPKLNGIRDVLKKPVSKKDLQAIAAPIFQGTLADSNPAKGRVWTDAELRRDFHLNDAQIDLYREFRAAVDQSLDDLAKTDVLRYVGKDVSEAVREQAHQAAGVSEAANILASELGRLAQETPKRADVLNDAARTVLEKARRAEALMRGGYAPLMRFGRYSVYVTRPGEGEPEQVYFGMFETEREANRMARRFREDPQHADADVSQGVMSQEAFKLFQGVSPETLELFGEVAGIESNDLFQDYLRLTRANRSAMKRLIERKGVSGFSEDTSRVLAAFITSNARAGSANLHLGALSESVEAVPKEQGDVKDEAVKLAEFTKGTNDPSSTLRGLLFIQFLGGSVASAFVNMTQSATTTFPYLAQFVGAGRAATDVARAMRQAVTGVGSDADLADALRRAESEGVVSPQEIHHLYAEAGVGLSRNSAVRRATFLWGALFSAAEQFNRRAAFIAAYRIGRQRGEDAYAFASKAVDETQFIYTRASRPNWMRNPVGATLFVFRTFTINYLEFLKRLPPAQQALALAVLMLAAGLEEMPFAEDAEDVIDTVAQALGYNWNTARARREWLTKTIGAEGADFVLHGLSATPGFPMDVSARLGVGNLIPGTGLLLGSTRDKSREITEVLGAPGSFAQSVVEGAGKALTGDLTGAAMDAAPLAVRNAVKGLDMYQTGMYRDSRGRRVMDVDGYDALVKAIGFQPAQVAAAQRKAGLVVESAALVRNTKARIAEQMAEARFERDPEKARKAREDLRDWNRKNPEARILIDESAINQRVKAMRATRAERLMKSTPKEIRRSIAEQL